MEKAKEFVMEAYGWSREKVDSYPISTILSMVAARDEDLYNEIRKDLRGEGYIV